MRLPERKPIRYPWNFSGDYTGIRLHFAPMRSRYPLVALLAISLAACGRIWNDPHPAFAKDEKGEAAYLSLPEGEIRSKYKLSDFPKTGTRELVADDYVYEIKRLAHPQLVSPIYSHMTDYIVGLKELGDRLKRDND